MIVITATITMARANAESLLRHSSFSSSLSGSFQREIVKSTMEARLPTSDTAPTSDCLQKGTVTKRHGTGINTGTSRASLKEPADMELGIQHGFIPSTKQSMLMTMKHQHRPQLLWVKLSSLRVWVWAQCYSPLTSMRSPALLWARSVIIPTLQIQQVRCRQVEEGTKVRRPSKWQSCCWIPGPLPHPATCKRPRGPEFTHGEAVRSPAVVHARPGKHTGELAWLISWHFCFNGRSKSCEKWEGLAHLPTLHLTMLLGSGKMGQHNHSAVQSLSCASPEALLKLPAASCRPGSQPHGVRAGQVCRRRKQGHARSRLSLTALAGGPSPTAQGPASPSVCAELGGGLFMSLSTGHFGHSAGSLLPSLNTY